MVHQGAVGWALPEAIAEHYLHRRRIAILAQRMAIECLKARFAERTRREQDEYLLRQEMEQAFPELQEDVVHTVFAEGGEAEAVRPGTIKERFPGMQWSSPDGLRVHTEFLDAFDKTQWRHLPFSLLDPVMWYWENVTWDPVVQTQGRGRGTTWLQLACDCEASTGTALFSKTPGGSRRDLTLGAKARLFALATMQIFRHRKARMRPKRVVSLTNLVPLGAGQLAGVSPRVNLMRHSEVAMFLANELVSHLDKNRPAERWKWHAARCGEALQPLWKGRRAEWPGDTWPCLADSDIHVDLVESVPWPSALGHGGVQASEARRPPRSSALGHDGEGHVSHEGQGGCCDSHQASPLREGSMDELGGPAGPQLLHPQRRLREEYGLDFPERSLREDGTYPERSLRKDSGSNCYPELCPQEGEILAPSEQEVDLGKGGWGLCLVEGRTRLGKGTWATDGNGGGWTGRGCLRTSM